MKVRLLIGLAGMLLATACSGGKKDIKDESKEGLIRDLKQFEDSLKKHQVDPSSGDVATLYADKCLFIYRKFPKSKEAPRYLDKAHIILSSVGRHGMAVLYADTLIQKYPSYDNRPMVLQSMASAYDLFIIPRRKELVKKYYTLLLKENPNLPKEEKEMIQYRLDHIDLTFDQMIELQMQEAAK